MDYGKEIDELARASWPRAWLFMSISRTVLRMPGLSTAHTGASIIAGGGGGGGGFPTIPTARGPVHRGGGRGWGRAPAGGQGAREPCGWMDGCDFDTQLSLARQCLDTANSEAEN
jgi:hypothetical protein